MQSYIIGFLLFILASYLFFSYAEKNFSNLESASNLVLESDNSIYGPKVDFNKVESWVGTGHGQEAKKLEVKKPEIKEAKVITKKPQAKSYEPIANAREIKLRPLRTEIKN